MCLFCFIWRRLSFIRGFWWRILSWFFDWIVCLVFFGLFVGVYWLLWWKVYWLLSLCCLWLLVDLVELWDLNWFYVFYVVSRGLKSSIFGYIVFVLVSLIWYKMYIFFVNIVLVGFGLFVIFLGFCVLWRMVIGVLRMRMLNGLFGRRVFGWEIRCFGVVLEVVLCLEGMFIEEFLVLCLVFVVSEVLGWVMKFWRSL